MDEEVYEERPKKKRKHRLLRFFAKLLLFLTAIGVIMYFTGLWKPLAAKIGADYIKRTMKTFSTEEFSLSANRTVPGSIPSDSVFNLLLVGIEGIGSDSEYGGRSDSMILISYDKNAGTLSLCSFLRDTYTEIPGHNAGKLNAAYAYGNMSLLTETLEHLYAVRIDAVARVNFEEFESVIDALGGVDVEISEEEAKYLNTTNYISDKENRTISAGINHMNGNQALGYCRVRKVKTPNGEETERDDYGRTLRQRKVLSAIIKAYQSVGKRKLLKLSSEILSIMTTSLTKEQVEACINSYLKKKVTTLNSYMIPAKGYFTEEKKNGAAVLVPDVEANRAILNHLLYHTELPEGIQYGEQ